MLLFLSNLEEIVRRIDDDDDSRHNGPPQLGYLHIK